MTCFFQDVLLSPLPGGGGLSPTPPAGKDGSAAGKRPSSAEPGAGAASASSSSAAAAAAAAAGARSETEEILVRKSI